MYQDERTRPCPPGTTTYYVERGDNYARIARRFNTTVQEILRANPGVNPRSLRIGQRLCIPEQRCPGNTYTVRRGDTPRSIARELGITVAELLAANPRVNPRSLHIGQVLCVPPPRPPRPPQTCPPGTFTYTIRRGDTINSIARAFQTTPQLILLANRGLNPNNLRVGQVICIPRGGNRYVNQDLGVSLYYPSNWRRVNEERYEGSDGFFQVGAISGTNQQEVCRGEAYHQLNPYGTSPTIVPAVIDGQQACYIIPSRDQPREMRNQAALIVSYPRPVTADGRTYQFFILWADNGHIREIGNTVTFLGR